MTNSERILLDRVNDFLFGNHNLTELDLKFQLDLEDKILSLKEGEHLHWYSDYNGSGNLFEMWKTYTQKTEWGTDIHPWCGPGFKSGITIRREHGHLSVSTKKGYGANWESFTA